MSKDDLIKKYIPKNLRDLAISFDIEEDFIKDMPDLIKMILASKSIDTNESKQNWLNLLPLMTSDQIQKLYDILLKEKEKLREIDEKYENKKMEIKKKYLQKWQQIGYIKKVGKIKEEESNQRSKEEQEAEDLLSQI
ncbi:hypothetical protein [Candidatus Vampirococcus lugosii]|uniref:Uncharacterized protein n=1 Tax=Candidatus Vampirococcus lugosii TaxID=2789015 RepID=A0ABS5QK97_9BACT|nr:hypothetical protein [Candidatus Vampirococcus lugosii]MBS8121666.1 hypothetical protein [Candidatus Vampirococcus lugosii]